MNVYSRFWNWLKSHRSGQVFPVPFDHAVKLSLRRLESRQVLSVSAVLVGLDVTFTGDDGGASADSLVFTIDNSGNLAHNQGGINGFNSNIDLDNHLAGDQTLAVSQLTSLQVLLGSDADAVDFAADFNFSSGSLQVEAESITAAGHSLSVQGLTTLDAGSAGDISLVGANNFQSISIVSAHNVTLNDTTGMTFSGATHVSGDLEVTALGSVSNDASAHVVVDGIANLTGTSIDLGNSLGDHMEFGSLSFHSAGTVNISEDSSLAISSASTAGSLTLVSVDDIDFNATVHVDGNTSVTAGTTTGGIGVHAKLTSTGSILLDAADEIVIDASIDPTTVTLLADDDITISAAIAADNLITISAGQDGSGSVILAGTGSLTADNVGNTADIMIQTGASTGNVTLTGTTTADDSVTITTAGSINGAGLMTANVIDLNAATGIGQITPLELAATTISLDSTTGNIEVHNTSAAAVSTFDVTSGNGNVIVLNANALAIQGTVNGNLKATAVTGNLTDSALLTVTGTSSFTTSQTDADIDLGTLAATGAVTLSTAGTSGNATIVNTTALALQGTVRGVLTATATTGNLTDSNTLTVTGASSFTTSQTNADIDLGTLDATGAVTLTTLGTTGNVKIVNARALGMQGVVRGDLTATATIGNLTDSALLTISGASSFTTSQTNADINLGTLAATGNVTVNTVGTSGNATLINATALALQGTVRGNLSARATTGNLTDSSTLTVTGTSSLTTSQANADIDMGTLAATGAVTLSTAGTTGDATIVNASALALRGTVRGKLNATATLGNITDSALLTVTGTSSFTTSQTNADIDLGTLAATGAVTLSTTGTSGDANVVNATALALQGAVSGNLTARATLGNLTDSALLTVTGTSSLTTSQTDADIDLGTLAATGNVTVNTVGTSGNATIVNATSLALQGTVNGNLNATATTGDLTDSNTLTVAGTSSFATSQVDADIDLGTLAATGAVTLNTVGTSGNAAIVNATALALQGTVHGNLAATATTGNLTDSALLTVTGTSNFLTSQADADIDLGTLASTGNVSLNTAGTSGNATVVNATALALQGTANGNLTATATLGDLSDSALLTVSGTSHLTTSQANADINFGTLAATGAVTLDTTGTSGDATIVNATALALQGTVNGNLIATATLGNLTDSALLTATGTSSFQTSQADADIDLGTLAATGAVTLNTAGTSGNATIVNATSLALQGTVNGNLAAIATTGNLTDSAILTVTGTSSFQTSQADADIDLGTLAATSNVSLNTTGTSGNATIVNATSLALQGTVNGNLAAIVTTGNLTDSALLTITGTSSFQSSQADADIDLGTLAATGAVTLNTTGTSGNATIVNATALSLQGTVNGNLTATATLGNLTDSALLAVTGTSSFQTSQADADIDFGTLAATGAVTLNTTGTSGNANVVNATALALQGTVNGNLTATATTGDLTDSNTLTVTGTNSFTTSQADADIDLGTLAATGAVTLNTVGTSGNATIVNATALALQGTVNGNLIATATTGNLTDSALLTVTGTSSFTTNQTDADIDLGTLAATGAVTLNTTGTSGNATIVNATALALQGTVNGNLAATATTGNLTDSALLTVTGTSSFQTSQADADIDLGTLAATGAVTLNTTGTSGNATIVNATALALQGMVNGNLTATATTGNLTDSALLTVTGTSSFQTSQADADIDLGTLAATGNVTLQTAGASGNVTIVNATALALQGTVNGNLAATATTGNLTDSALLTVTGTSSFTTSQADADIDLGTLAVTGAVTLNTAGTSGNATIVNSTALALQGTVNGNLTATATLGDLSDSALLTVSGTSHLTTSQADADINFGTLAATGAVTLDTTGTSGDATIVNATALALQGTVNGNLIATATTGNLTDSALLTVTGTSSFTTSQADADIDLGTLAATGAVTLNTVGTSGNATIVNATSLALQGTVNGNLNATATTGDLTDSNTLTVTGTSAFSASGDILLDVAANNFVGSVSASGANVELRDVNSLLLGQINASTLTVNAGGLVTIGTGAGEDLVVAGTVILNSTLGGVTEAAGSIVSADKLLLLGTGTYTLNEANVVATLAANVVGALSEVNASSLTIGKVGTTSGLTSSGDIAVTASTGDLTLDQVVNAGTGNVSLEATTGSILDGNDGLTQITAKDLSLIAQTNIGDITNFSTGSGNAIDVALSGQLTKASVSDAGGEIFLNFAGNLTAAAGSVNVGGANAASAILRATGGDIDVGTAAGVFSLSSGDNLGLEAIRVGASGGVLTLPDAGLNVGTGDLRLRGDQDVRDVSGRTLGPIVADDLSFTSGASGGDTTLITAVNTLTAQVTGSGAALTINEADGLTLTDIDTTDGNLTVNASQVVAGDITVLDVNAGTSRVTLATTDHGGGQIIDGDSVDSSTTADITASEIDLRAGTGIANSTKLEVATSSFAATTVTGDINVRDVSGDLSIASLAGGTSGVSITAGIAGDDICVTTVGSLAVNANVTNNGTGDRAILLAADGTTALNDLTIFANVTTTGGNSGITLLAGDTVSFGGTTTTAAAGTGEVQVRAGRAFNNGAAESTASVDGDILMADGAVIRSDNGNITLSAPDDVQLSIVNANFAGATGDIFITADADSSGSGGITEVLTGEASNLIGDVGTLSAATGIGSAGGASDLDTTLGTLVATNTTSGNIYVQETNALVIGGAGVQTLQGNGSISIDVDAGLLSVDGAVTAQGSGNITLNADAAAVDLNAIVSSTTGAIVISGDAVTQKANITTGGAGTVDVTADNGSITMQDGTSTSTQNGQILYQATSNVALSQLQSTSGPLQVTADSDVSGAGAITDNTAGESANLVTTGTATLRAATGIGSVDDIDTSIGTLAATNTTSGNIAIQETSGLVIGGTGVQTQGGSGSILIDVDAGDLTVNSAVTAQGDGNVVLNVDAGAAELFAAVSSTTGDLTITADSVNQNAGGNLSTGTALLQAGTIAVTADQGSITMADGTSATTGSGSITYLATGDVALGLLTTTSGAINVTAGNGPSVVGAITDNTAGETPNLVTSGTATLIAETGIGSAGGAAGIDTSVAVLRVVNSTSGNIDITETDAVQIVQLSQAGGGDASLRTTNGTITVDNANAVPNAVTVSDGGSLLLDANGATADIIVNDGVQANGGNITLLADRNVIANSAPISSVSGNGNIDVQAGHDIQILDPGDLNAVDISVEGAGSVSLMAGNKLVLGSQNPSLVSNVLQHTLANDVLIQTGTGSITNTLPLAYDLQSPQVTASGEALLSVTVGRPGESNLAIRIFWGDGTVETVTGLTPGTYVYSHFYAANPNPNNPSAPILINVQTAHDPLVMLHAPNVNTSVRSIPNAGVAVPPPVPAQNINADLSAAVYNPLAPGFTELQPNVAAQPGSEANPGFVIFQDTTLLATTVPVPGDGLATAVFDTTPPVSYLTFPEAPKVVDTQPQGVVLISSGTLSQYETSRSEDTLLEERAVILEVLSPDGSILQRVVLPETALDDMHDVIGKLPDGGYRFLLKEPGEDRLRLLLEFEVRQGKIADETDASDRPPAATQKKVKSSPENAPAPVESDNSGQPNESKDAEPLMMQIPPLEGRPVVGEGPLQSAHREPAISGEAESGTAWAGWSSVRARLAWTRAGQSSTPHGMGVEADLAIGDHHAGEDTGGGISIASFGAMAAIIGLHSASGQSSDSEQSSATLSRTARLIRKFQNARRSVCSPVPGVRVDAL